MHLSLYLYPATHSNCAHMLRYLVYLAGHKLPRDGLVRQATAHNPPVAGTRGLPFLINDSRYAPAFDPTNCLGRAGANRSLSLSADPNIFFPRSLCRMLVPHLADLLHLTCILRCSTPQRRPSILPSPSSNLRPPRSAVICIVGHSSQLPPLLSSFPQPQSALEHQHACQKEGSHHGQRGPSGRSAWGRWTLSHRIWT